jgi:uncharacterized protein
MKKRDLISGFCLSCACLAPLISLGASFDCSRKVSSVERVICSNEELSKLDDMLAAAYKTVRARSPNDTQLAREQRQWLTRRDACGNNLDCLRAAYKERVKDLETQSIGLTTNKMFDGAWDCSKSQGGQSHSLRLGIKDGKVTGLAASSVLERGKEGADSYVCEFNLTEVPKHRQRIEGGTLVVEGRSMDDAEILCVAQIRRGQQALQLAFHGCSSMCPANYQVLDGYSWTLIPGTTKCR